MIKKIINFLKGTKISSREINASSINTMTIGADIISINNEFGHYEIGKYQGFTGEINGAIFIGGICVGKK